MKLQLLILCFSAHLYAASALSSDGLTLLSLLNHWAVVSPPIDSSWKFSDSTPCSWVGVQCNHDGNVVALNLTASGITGELGPEIGNLSHLQTLVLLTNDLTGRIPPELGNCSMLEYIDLSENHFQSQIPYTVKNLQNLRFMSFSSNMLDGDIPESLFHIPHLEEVYLYNNYLSGSIPSSIGNCSNLKALLLNGNRLEGVLPQSLSNLKKLFILDLSFNVFSGGIPSGLGNCSSLAKFVAMNSNLVGIIPSSLGLLLKLSILLLPENHLSGKIPPEIGNCESLMNFHLYSNQLVGEIPHELGRLSKLQDLELNFNSLTGEIPLSIWQIQSLQHILVHNNSLSGKLPQVLTELKHLKNLSLFDNQFSGIIPQSLGINSSLVMLDLGNNKFTGNIPPNLCFGKKLRLLHLGLNQLQGSIPHDVGRCATLRRLVLSKNNLSGSLPEFESNQNLKYMDISKNIISGAIPSSLGNCTNLTALILSANMISRIIPSELGNLVNLQFLNLAQNMLDGPLPQQLSYCTKMERFDVGFNFLNGSLPSSFRNWTGLTTLILTENCFSGVIPSFLSEFDQLLELQLGGNMFGGEIPKSMGTMQNLLYGLNLSGNGFRGEVPLEIGMLKKLQSLDVSLNNLTGSILILGELSSLIEVNISYNSFAGPVPNWLMQFLNSSPSSFFGNPGLCVSCSSCNKTSYLMPCENYKSHKSTRQQNITKIVILIIGLGSSMLVAFLLVKLIHIHLSIQRSKEMAVANYEVQEPLFCGGVRGHRIIDLIYKHQVIWATDNLNDLYIIARGAHGIVYKAELFHFGVFAVKKLFTARNGRKRLKMPREIEISRNLKHQYVARCLGSWIGKDYSLVFYRYMENGSLHDVLHDNPPQSFVWNDRYNIADGVAKGLAYLHHGCNPPILHRDIKPKNILLDSHMNPYITDFGLAIALNQTSDVKRMRSTYNHGTPGFMPPEIATSVVPSCKYDIYSYGVVLLELVTGKKVLDSSFLEETTLVKWFHSIWRVTRDIEEIVDSSLARELSDLNVVTQVIKVFLVALICTYKDPGKRLNMEDVIKIYEAPTIQGIFVQHDRTSFHLGRALAAAVESIYPQARTIVVKGFPKDVKQRELPNLLRWLPGYEASEMSFTVGYALFKTEQQAVAAKDFLQDLLFDAKTNSVLRTEMADKHYFVEGGPYDRGKQLWTDEDYPPIGCASTSASSSSNYHPPGVWGMYGNMASPPTPYILYACLHDVLHVQNPLRNLRWNVRYKIAVGIAHELAYLYHDCDPPIVPQDLNPKNIFLDSDMEPHICQFGVSMPMNPSSSPPGEPSAIVPVNAGTLAENGHRMVEAVASDVHDYGVVLLELLTKKKLFDSSFQKKTDFLTRVRFVWSETGNLKKIVDLSLARELSDLTVMVQVTKVLSIALLCTEEDPHNRPTMRTIIKLL